MTAAQLAYQISHRPADEQEDEETKDRNVEEEGEIVGPSSEAGNINAKDTNTDKPSSNSNTTDQREIAELLAEENIVDLSEADREKLTELDAITGEALPVYHVHPSWDDIYLGGLVICNKCRSNEDFDRNHN
eukprot:scaffold365712_cov37-Prasinocladus_malaysianus.AAC.1